MPATRDVLRFPGTLEGLAEGAVALRRLLDTRNVHGDARYHVELAFDEVAANIVRHGRPTGEVTVAVRFDEDEIVLVFEDDGVPFDPRDQPDAVLPPSLDEAQVGGLGLTILRTFLTRMAYERTPQHRNLLTVAIPARSGTAD